jgi:hypothetical protein
MLKMLKMWSRHTQDELLTYLHPHLHSRSLMMHIHFPNAYAFSCAWQAVKDSGDEGKGKGELSSPPGPTSMDMWPITDLGANASIDLSKILALGSSVMAQDSGNRCCRCCKNVLHNSARMLTVPCSSVWCRKLLMH